MSQSKENTVGSSPSSAPNKSGFRYFLDQAVQLLGALLIVFTIRSTIVEPFKIPSGSMIPTLYVGDFIFVNKFAYQLRVPFTELFDNPITIIDRGLPKRGDIIVFRYPRDTSIHHIKRVVGLPGDKIEIKDKVIYVNGEATKSTEVTKLREETILKDVGDNKYDPEYMRMYEEKLGDHEHLMMTDDRNDYIRNFDEITVPPGRLFVMGDNRDFSNDSRFWGFVPVENVAGKAMVIWLSMWLNFSDSSQTSFKPDRIGTVLK